MKPCDALLVSKGDDESLVTLSDLGVRIVRGTELIELCCKISRVYRAINEARAFPVYVGAITLANFDQAHAWSLMAKRISSILQCPIDRIAEMSIMLSKEQQVRVISQLVRRGATIKVCGASASGIVQAYRPATAVKSYRIIGDRGLRKRSRSSR